MVNKSYEELDDLLTQIRLLVLRVRQNDAATADELKSLLSQLEFWLESLIIDSLKLKDLESAKQRARVSTERRPKTPARKQKAR